jgi:Protein of unknown function (DUF998)
MEQPNRQGVLLSCGILAALLYAGADVLGASRLDGYLYRDQTISELTAIGAPSRPLLLALLLVHNVLLIAFGMGVWASAGRVRALRVTGALLVGIAAVGMVAVPFFPMHPRGAETSFTDVMHIALTAFNALCILLAMALASSTGGRPFRVFSIASMLTLLGFGALTGLQGPRIAAGLPTPWVGVTERLSFAAYLLWLLAVVLLRRTRERPTLRAAGGSDSADPRESARAAAPGRRGTADAR